MEYPATQAGAFKPEIQGLRAIAVLAVLLFHVWPNALTGGFVGVDVFFVISGYLITGLLLKEAERTGTISLSGFYARRIRRLLPASTLVILVAGLLVGVLPAVQWADTAMEMVASTLYVQNWWLAAQAVDYLAEGNAPGLLQHYWSLSVEEQYYIFWPLIFLAANAFGHPLRDRPRFVFSIIIGAIGVASLAYSVYLTEANPGLAYFATTTRAWELALGSGLAVLGNRFEKLHETARCILGWLGLLCILIACTRYDRNVAFPGYAALLPTLGAALVIFAGQAGRSWGAHRVLRLRPFQYLGDISYSLYLWHWIVIIVFSNAAAPPGWAGGLLAIAISVGLAHLTKIYVEDPVRLGTWRGRKIAVNSVLTMSVCFALTMFVANAIWIFINDQAESNVQASVPITPELLKGKYDPSRPTVPPILEARRDNPDVYRLKCHVDQVSSEPTKCEFGSENAKHNIVLTGDSHAAQWLPMLQELYGKRSDWKIITYTKSACAFTDARVGLGKKGEYVSCTEWNKRVMDELRRLKPDILVTSQSSGHRAVGLSGDESQQELAAGLLRRWKQVSEIGTRVAVIRDTPWMDRNIPECLSAPDGNVRKCSTKAERAFKSDSIVVAMKQHPDVLYFDIGNKICGNKVCEPIKGQVLIWRDRHHLTATFARLLAPEFASLLELKP